MTQLAIGEATPHGATYDGHGVNFTLFSAHAERVELCVFDSRGNERRYDLQDVAAMSGMVIWQEPGQVCAMAIAYMARGSQRRGIGLIRRSYCLTLMRAGSRAN